MSQGQVAFVRPGGQDPFELLPGQSLYSSEQNTGLGRPTAIATAVVLRDDNLLARVNAFPKHDVEPIRDPVGRFSLAVTAYHVNPNGGFVISVTNTCQAPVRFQQLQVVWSSVLG